jgi:hypothetical protein
MKTQANDSERSTNQPAGEVLKPLDENAFGIALEAAMQTVTSGQYSSDADLRAAEIEHDRQYARTLISAYLAALPKPTDEFARGVEAAAQVAEKRYDQNGTHPDYKCAGRVIAGDIRSLSPDTVGVPREALEKRPYAFGIEARDGRHLYWDEELCAHHAEQQNVEYFGLYRRSALLATPLQLDEDRELRSLSQEAQALEQFTEYFVRNYPGPETVIHNPKWHAPRIFRAALSALSKRAGEREGKEARNG